VLERPSSLPASKCEEAVCITTAARPGVGREHSVSRFTDGGYEVARDSPSMSERPPPRAPGRTYLRIPPAF